MRKNGFRIINKVRSLIYPKRNHGKMITMYLEENWFQRAKKPQLAAGYTLRNYADEDYWQVSMLYIKSNIGFCDIDYFKPNLLPNGHKLIVDEINGRVVGSILAIESFENCSVGRLEWLAVDERHRGKGLGAVLSYEITSKLTSANYRRVELNTFEKMTSAIATYKKNGWRLDK